MSAKRMKKATTEPAKKKKVASPPRTEAAQRRARIRKGADDFRAMLAVPRPGMKQTAITEKTTAQKIARVGLEISDVFYVSPAKLKPNPLNEYPPLDDDELAELVADIRAKGVIVPLLSRTDDVLICGHNRRAAALRAKLDRVPVQRVLGELSPELERDIMRSENDRRRGGNWTKAKKEKFVQENFGAAIEKTGHGGRRGNQYTGGQGSMNLAREIEKKSRGKISEGTAKRIVSEIRKKKTGKKVAKKVSEKKTKAKPIKSQEPRTGSYATEILFTHLNCMYCKEGPRRDRRKKYTDCHNIGSPLHRQTVGRETLCSFFEPLTGAEEQRVIVAARPLLRMCGPPVRPEPERKRGRR